MKYQFLEHTADVKFLAYGKDLEEAFTNCALATMRIITEDNIKPVETKQIKVSAKRKRSLLYDFLEELIFLMDTEGFLVSEIKELTIKEDEELTLTATIQGDSADNYEVLTHIKSVTYSDMFIKEETGKVTIQVVHDI
jgi:SHS2 domain-containing protein